MNTEFTQPQGSGRGYDGNAFLFIRHTVTTFAPVVSLQAGSAVRVGLGPALHRIGTQRSSAPEGAVRLQTRLGLIADIALSFPTQTRFFVTLKAQYRHVGSVDVGPFEVSGFENDSVFPKTRISFSHGFLGAGFGIRL